MAKRAKKRVYLRPLVAGDAREFIDMVRSSRKLHRPWVTPPDERSAFLHFVRRKKKRGDALLVVAHAADDRMVGVINIAEIVRSVLQSGYLGYFASAEYAGQGLMTEGLALVMRHAFRAMKLHRLEANIQPANLASIALVRRCGFHLEGFSPRYLKIGGRWRDHERWAVLSDA